MEFKAKRDDGLVHTFDVTSQILIPSYCGKTDCHYKEATAAPERDAECCEECERVANGKRVEVGDFVRIKADGSEGTVRILEGSPARKAYVDIIPGANGGYVYMRMLAPSLFPAPVTFALNPYDLDELELVE
jgi:hypothetical protein